MIVEFSDTGALYVYNQNHEKVKMVTGKKRYIPSTADLKITSMGSLIDISDWYYNTYNEEGRMTHRGNWQGRLSSWLQQKVISSNNTGISFQDAEDNDLFKAIPVQKEEFNPSSSSVSKTSSDKTNMIVYEFNVSFSLSSKWIANGKCRIVCGFKGFYLNLSSGNQFVYLRSLINGASLTGSIWIRKIEYNNGWQEVVHSNSGREISVGYLKETNGVVLYKQKIEQTDYMTIKI